MGGRPLTALSIAAFPETDFPLEWAAAIVRGGAEQAARGRLRAARRPHRARSRDQVRLRGHGPRGPGAHADQRRRPRRATSLVLTKPLGTGRDRHRAQGRAGARGGRAGRARARWRRSTASRPRSRCATACAPPPTSPASASPATPRNVARESRVTHRDRAWPTLPLLPGARELAARYQPARPQGEPPAVRAARRGRGRGGRGAPRAALRPADLRRPAPPRPGGGGGRAARRPEPRARASGAPAPSRGRRPRLRLADS